MKRWLLSLCLLCVLASASSFVRAEDAQKDESSANNFQYQTVTTKDGLTFRVPEDMPIEKRNGIEQPIPFDEYMYGKFKQMEVRLKSMESQLDRVEKLLNKIAAQKEAASTLKSE